GHRLAGRGPLRLREPRRREVRARAGGHGRGDPPLGEFGERRRLDWLHDPDSLPTDARSGSLSRRYPPSAAASLPGEADGGTWVGVGDAGVVAVVLEVLVGDGVDSSDGDPVRVLVRVGE